MNAIPAVLQTIQTDFSQAIFGGDRNSIGASVRTQGNLSAEQRVGIYRNSVHGVLWKYLASVFVVCEQLVGEKFFEQLCDRYIDQYPPTTPFLADYGDQFADFVHHDPALATLPWLSDVARLEWARHCAWHGVNQPASDFAGLGQLTPEQQLTVIFQLPHSAQLLGSAYATHAIWLAHQAEDYDDKPKLEHIKLHQPCYLLIHRSGRRLHQLPLDKPMWAFLSAVRQGHTLATLSEQFGEHITGHLTQAIQQNWITAYR